MAKKPKRDYYYVMPGAADGARETSTRQWTVAVLVGAGVAGIIAAVLYYTQRL